VDLAIEGQRRLRSEFDGAAIQDRQRPGHAQADRTNVGIGPISEFRAATAEDFGVCQQAGMYFQADDRLEFHAGMVSAIWYH
jgi:hypothetical protein